MGNAPRVVRYGVDGFPYLAGCRRWPALCSPVGALALRRQQWWAGPVLAAGAAAAAPAAMGLHYVLRGKFRLRDHMLDVVAWRGAEVVADLGSGGGLLGLAAAARTRGPVHCVDLFIGKDLSGNTAERLHRNAAALGVAEQVQVHEQDVRRTGLADAAVDVVLSSLCLHNLPGAGARAEALDEVVRILPPGGIVVLSDLAHVDDEYGPHLRRAGCAPALPTGLPVPFRANGC
jgi:arsenite methyltransferase